MYTMTVAYSAFYSGKGDTFLCTRYERIKDSIYIYYTLYTT